MDRISGILVLLLGLGMLCEGRKVSFGSLSAPGPALFPTILAVILIILSLALIIRKEVKEEGAESPLNGTTLVRRLLPVIVSLLVYVFVLEYLGFLLAGFLLMTFLFLKVGSQKAPVAVLGSFISIGLAYLLFGLLMKSNLPRGLLGF